MLRVFFAQDENGARLCTYLRNLVVFYRKILPTRFLSRENICNIFCLLGRALLLLVVVASVQRAYLERTIFESAKSKWQQRKFKFEVFRNREADLHGKSVGRSLERVEAEAREGTRVREPDVKAGFT